MTHRSPSRRAALAVAAVVTTSSLVTAFVSAPASAAPDPATGLAKRLVRQTTAADANRHLIALQRISDRNGGNRAAPDAQRPNSPGYDASVGYFVTQLRKAGFTVRTPKFSYEVQVEDAASLTVGAKTYRIGKLSESIDTPVGGTAGPIRVVPEDATTGCEASDFAGQDFTGSTALIRRGGCTFSDKALNAAAAGAATAVISNNVAGPLGNVTLGTPGPIPVGGVSQADGDTLAKQAGDVAVVDMRYSDQTRTSVNVIAETRTGKKNNVVMAGAHLDAVYGGINDNGSGAAALLDVATKLGGSPKAGNTVRFAFWGAEELGLIGSEEYVKGLSFEQQLDIALYLNFDMVGSPNAAYFVYDGDNSDAQGAGPGPYGSAMIEKTFTDFYADTLKVPTEGTDFDGRSDYGGFIANGIPAGGLFSGAEGVKTASQAAKWGGTAGVAYDPCYHQVCDNLGNIDRVALDRNLDAMAWSVGLYAQSTQAINGVPARSQRMALRTQQQNKKLPTPNFVPLHKSS